MVEYDPQEEQLVKKLDQRIIPVLVMAYVVALVVGSFPFVLPSTLLLRFLQPARWLGEF
ncbi:hypothetical protein HDU67_005119 [Dinochytrium kinnereticum]|nr:hypothetical protein HDU67_005119 [Dinochytrium kinnereticum]